MTSPRHENESVVRWDFFSADGRVLDLELDRRSGRFALCVVRYDEDAEDWRVVYEFDAEASRLGARCFRAAFLDGSPAVR